MRLPLVPPGVLLALLAVLLLLPPVPLAPLPSGERPSVDARGEIHDATGRGLPGLSSPSPRSAPPEWTNLTASSRGPSARVGSASVYDARDGYLLLFGGSSPNGRFLNDTWSFQGGRWSNLTATLPVSPPAAGSVLLTFDAATDLSVLFEGTSGATWTYGSGRWAAVNSSGPSARSGASLAYDAAWGRVVLFGGRLPSGYACQETWTFTPSGWQNDTGSTGVPPAARWGAAMATDPGLSGNAVLFGGYNGSYLNDTWALGSSGWVEVSSGPHGLLGRWGAGLTWDPEDSSLLLVGGTGSSGPFNETWLFADPATGWNPAAAGTIEPGARSELVLATDAWDAVAVLFGGIGPSTTLNSTWEWGGEVAAPALSGSFVALPAAIDLGGSVSLQVSSQGGSPPYSFGLRGLPPGCTAAGIPPWSCSPTSPGNFSLTLFLNDSGAGAIVLTTWVFVSPSPTFTSFSASPASFSLGGTTTLTALPRGGTLPLTLSYSGLPPGCSSANTSSLLCRPTRAGNFTIHATVRDAVGRSATDPTGLTVSNVSAPRVSLAYAPASPTPGTRVTVTSTTTGGVGPLRYAWTENGSSILDASSTWTFVPGNPGNYSFSVTVQDAVGRTSIGSLVVDVQAPPTPPPPAPSPFVVAVNVSQSSIPSGGSIEFTATEIGGVGPFSYTWVLDGSNTTAHGDPWTVAFAQSGTHQVEVWVVSAQGVAVRSTVASIVVSAPVGGGSPSYAGLTPTQVWEVVGVLCAVGLGCAVLGLSRRFGATRSPSTPTVPRSASDPPPKEAPAAPPKPPGPAAGEANLNPPSDTPTGTPPEPAVPRTPEAPSSLPTAPTPTAAPEARTPAPPLDQEAPP